MTPTRGRVFIVWGRNVELAKEVAVRLNHKGFYAVRGGGTASAQLAVHQALLNEMTGASWAIVLAQWPYEKDPDECGQVAEAVEGSSPDPPNGEDLVRVFRPNPMYEWGYLQGRLAPGIPNRRYDPAREKCRYLHVFLIGGISEQQLPKDLLGVHVEKIGFGPRVAMADEIVALFMKNLHPYIVDPFDVLKEWRYYRTWIDRQISGEDALRRCRPSARTPAQHPAGFLSRPVGRPRKARVRRLT